MNKSSVPKTGERDTGKVTKDGTPADDAPSANNDPLSNMSLGEKQGMI